jgi:hypothetical protein
MKTKRNTKSFVSKVRPLGNLTDTYYTSSSWKPKTIDGVEFVSVVKLNPIEFPMKTQTVHWMRKDNLETVK